MKRLAIYMIYDKDGVIDDYIPYYLNDLTENVSHLIVVCNGRLNDEGRAKLEKFTGDVYVRPNSGFDAGAYKDVLLNYLGWDKLCEYDELLLCNDTMYGAIFPLRRVFDEMDTRDIDFWGIMEGPKLKNKDPHSDSEYTHKYVISNFINLKSSIIKSNIFKTFWTEMKESITKSECVTAFEIGLSNMLRSAGYRYSVYCDSYLCSANADYVMITHDPYSASAYFRAPLIRRRTLFEVRPMGEWCFHGTENNNKLLDYVKNNTEYDVNLIWSNLLRRGDITKIRDNLRLRYVLPSTYTQYEDVALSSAAVIISMEAYSEYYLHFLKNLPCDLNVLIITGDASVYDQLSTNTLGEKIRIASPCDFESAWNCLVFDEFLKYEYICYIGLDDRSSPRELMTDINIAWENTLASEEYIKNVIHCFEDNSRLGHLSIPLPYHGSRLTELTAYWGGDAFWFRTAVIKKLPEQFFEEEKLQTLKRILPHAAQNAGYYSAIVLSDQHSATRSSDLEYMLGSILERIGKEEHFNNFDDVLWYLEKKALLDFRAKHPNTFIYGVGKYAEKCLNMLESSGFTISGFIVSDGKRKETTHRGFQIYYLSELPVKNNDCGIILGISKNYVKEVYPALVEKGFNNVLRLSFG